MLPLPDLLHLEPRPEPDSGFLKELLETSFLGGDVGTKLDGALAETAAVAATWEPEHFVSELFLDDFISGCLSIELEDGPRPVHAKFLHRVLSAPPTDLESVRFRQEIVRELEGDAAMLGRVQALHAELFRLLAFFKAPKKWDRLDYASFRLDTLRKARDIVTAMIDGFGEARSGLRRLHEVGLEIRASREFRILAALLDYEGHLATLDLEVRIGADGRLRDVAVREVRENAGNPFHRGPWRRWIDLARLWLRRYSIDSGELVNRVILDVYLKISPAIRALLQVMGHLEVYLTTLSFARLAESRGLAVSLAEIGDHDGVELEELFNPLLLRHEGIAVPTSIVHHSKAPVTVITGPNSGGKTRLLQAVGLAQLLAQSGLYAPARSARLPLVDGLFAALSIRDEADQTEGHLGTELLRVRTLFERAPRRSLILLDELCSGTNPSEAIEIFSMVLRLLRRLHPVAYITTHFLDFAQELERQPPIPGLEFLQVEVADDRTSTYQFVPGVAATSLASTTAERLGVTFDELARTIDERQDVDDDRRGGEPEPEPLVPQTAVEPV